MDTAAAAAAAAAAALLSLSVLEPDAVLPRSTPIDRRPIEISVLELCSSSSSSSLTLLQERGGEAGELMEEEAEFRGLSLESLACSQLSSIAYVDEFKKVSPIGHLPTKQRLTWMPSFDRQYFTRHAHLVHLATTRTDTEEGFFCSGEELTTTDSQVQHQHPEHDDDEVLLSSRFKATSF